MRRFLSVLLLTALLLAGGTTASAANAGSAADPLVSMSYAKTWAEGVVSSREANINAKLNPIYAAAVRYLPTAIAQPSGAAKRDLASGSVIKLTEGASITVLSGNARGVISSGTVINTTVGGAASNGRLNLNRLYIACKGAEVTVTMNSAGSALIDGDHTVTSAPMTFSDVVDWAWYHADVYRSVELGLIDGVGGGRFAPNDALNRISAIKLAACMHQLHEDGKVTLVNGNPWYEPYLTYAVSEGVIDAAYGSMSVAQLSAGVSRAEYVHIFYGALPATEYAAINAIPDDSIPDMRTGATYGSEVYTFYRAGILTGTDAGLFLPDKTISRCEVAAVLTRMFDATARKTFTME